MNGSGGETRQSPQGSATIAAELAGPCLLGTDSSLNATRASVAPAIPRPWFLVCALCRRDGARDAPFMPDPRVKPRSPSRPFALRWQRSKAAPALSCSEDSGSAKPDFWQYPAPLVLPRVRSSPCHPRSKVDLAHRSFASPRALGAQGMTEVWELWAWMWRAAPTLARKKGESSEAPRRSA
jgi:hypothetical protein